MDDVEEVFEYFCDRTPASFVEKEQSFLSWHYRDCDAEFGEQQARDLLIHLKSGPLINTSTEVVHSNKLVQVRPTGISKGHTLEKIVSKIVEQNSIGFFLCLGNFLGRDEDMFLNLERKGPPSDSRSPRLSMFSRLQDDFDAITVTIGARASLAKNYVRNVADVQSLLMQMAGTVKAAPSISQHVKITRSFPSEDSNFI